MVVTGVRWAESARRKEKQDTIKIIGRPKATIKIADELGIEYKTINRDGLILNDDNDESRRLVEQCYRTRKTILNPIIDWTDEDVWYYLNEVVKVEHCCLYEWQNRIGCIGCPIASRKSRNEHLARFPAFEKLYIKAFDRMIEERNKAGKTTTWKNGKEVFEWYINQP